MISAINSVQSINQTRAQAVQRQSFKGLQKNVALQAQNNPNPSFTQGLNRAILAIGGVTGTILGLAFYMMGFNIAEILIGLGLGTAVTFGVAAWAGRR